jgi:hypothetical protein
MPRQVPDRWGIGLSAHQASIGVPFAKMVPMSINSSPRSAARCDCHEWHPVAAIGDWLHRTGPQVLAPVRGWARSGIWQEGRCQLSHAEMTSQIRAVGGITCGYALAGRNLLAGGVELVDGVHRWTVAGELGIDLVPVKMSAEEADSPFAW